MKKVCFFIAMIFVFSCALSADGTKFTFTIHGNYLQVPENSFLQQVKQKKACPEGKISVTVFRNFYVWGSYGTFPVHDSWTKWSNKGAFEKDIEVDRVLKKNIYSAGLGFFAGYIEQNAVALKIELGICAINNSIDSSFIEIASRELIASKMEKQSGVGIRGNFGITYGFYKNLFTEISLGYMYASVKPNNTRINLGGFQFSVGLGIKL